MDFNKSNGPHVTANLLPHHFGPNVNTIMEELGTRIKMKVDEVKSLMDEVYKALIEMGVIPKMKIFWSVECNN